MLQTRLLEQPRDELRVRTADQASRPFRIALILYFSPRKLGSLEAWLVALARGLRERGHIVVVFCRGPVHPEVASQLREAGVEWEHVDNLGGGLLQAVRRLRRFDVVHMSFVSPLGRLGLSGYLAWPTRILMVDHNSRRDSETLRSYEGMRPPPEMPGRLQGSIVSALARLRLSSVAGVSDYVRRCVRRELKLSDQQTRTIHNGVDLARFHPASTENRPPHDLHTVLCIAHLIPEKGIELLIRSIVPLDPRIVRLVVVGDGMERERLELLARELGIERRVEFCGLRDDTDHLLRAADIFVHPAVWGEAFGLAIAEAMASGCAVIASSVGAIPELIEDGVSGLLVPPGNVESLTAAILGLIEAPALRQNLAAAARRRVEESFGLEECVESHVEWCERAAVPTNG